MIGPALKVQMVCSDILGQTFLRLESPFVQIQVRVKDRERHGHDGTGTSTGTHNEYLYIHTYSVAFHEPTRRTTSPLRDHK